MKNLVSKYYIEKHSHVFFISVPTVMLRNAQINQNRIRNLDYGIVYNIIC